MSLHCENSSTFFLHKYSKLFHNIPVTSCETNKLVEPGDVISKNKKRYLRKNYKRRSFCQGNRKAGKRDR